MATKRLPRPRDPVQLGKLMVDILSGQAVDAVEDGKDAAAVERGRLGGQRGGDARAQNLTSEQRRTIAKKAAKKRWSRASDPVS
jgi:hypothetical protein